MSSDRSSVRVDRVVAVAATLRDGREQVGSGYLISGRLVLTAAHCTRDKATGEAAARLRVVRPSDGAVADVADVVSDRGLDVAVLRLADDAPWEAGLSPVVFARVDQNQSGVLDDCTGIGFALFQRDPDWRTRHTSEFHGRIYQTDERESGRLLMREPLIHPGPVTGLGGEALSEQDKEGSSPWGGLSGALVFYRGSAIGVVVEHHPRQGDSALRVIGFEQIATASAEIRQCLGLSGRGSLPFVSEHRGEIAVYLTTLIDWLNSDPWPRDRRFGANTLTPAAIERRLRVTVTGQEGKEDLDADELAQQCQRLVILGGPGAGKTWLAKRTARRCADDALEALAAGGALEEVELPLYTTCSRLFTAHGDIRTAAVSSALDQLGDLGGSRPSAVLRDFFIGRNAPTLLIIDSLDEAQGDDERLRQADTLPWRIVLTSRPNSWNHQLAIPKESNSHRIGELQPLRYPYDVEPFIRRWFAERPEWGEDLTAQIARRPGLQQAATVPLILAFYCIVGGGQVLPEFRRDLHDKVLKRMLTGRWRGSHERPTDVETCLQTLQAWAWSGAASHPVSGVGMWADDIPTERGRLCEADEDALDHVATPVGPPDVDTGKTLRRFVHRSIREHLVAEHVARLPLDEAAEALLPHLWCDPDWEYAAPGALATHPQHDQLLRALIGRAARSDQIPCDLSVIDAGWEFRGLLARVASESDETDWSPEIAGMIGQARVELAGSGRAHDLGGTARWETSNRPARGALLGVLARATDSRQAAALTGWVALLAPTAEDRCRARASLLGLLTRETSGLGAGELVRAVVQLNPTAEDRHQAREALLEMLAREVSRESSGDAAETLVEAVVQLAPTAEDRHQAREALLDLLAHTTHSWSAQTLADGVVQLASTAEDRSQARETLLGLLARQTSSLQAVASAGGLVQLDPTPEDRRQAREALLGLLAREALLGLLARAVLLGLLARESNGFVSATLADAVVRLDPTAEDRRQVRSALLGMLALETTGLAAAALAGGLAPLAPTTEERHRAREAVLGVLDRENNGFAAAALADEVAQLAPTAKNRHRARAALLGVLDREANIWSAGT